MYLIVHAVDGLAPGSYAYIPDRGAVETLPWAGGIPANPRLELLQAGDFRDRAGYLGLEQDLPADASADLYFLTDLTAVLARYGNR
ncbi:MAG TPA: hypothetical protein VI855_00045, partial [Dehalococcoidia bacterium]|nr:hypothetical protein [Dehalococcoidia bacterium]